MASVSQTHSTDLRGRKILIVDDDRLNIRILSGILKPEGYELAHAEIEAADIMIRKVAAMFQAGLPCGDDANMAKMLVSEAAWHAAEACMQTHGGFGYAREYDVERKWRETRLLQIAPVSTNMILAYIGEHILGMPRSY